MKTPDIRRDRCQIRDPSGVGRADITTGRDSHWRIGGKAADARNAVDSPGGWGAILESFKICAES